MPELPEVETMVRGIRPHIEGRQILTVQACDCPCRPMLIEPELKTIQARVQGATVDRIRRRAKRVVMDLSTGDAFVIEPRMTGLMLLDEPPSVEHLRVEWTLSGSREFDRLTKGRASTGSRAVDLCDVRSRRLRGPSRCTHPRRAGPSGRT